MISVADADRILAQFRGFFPEESVPLEAAAGRILREDIRADRAYPAQDRSRMDGIAIAFAAWEMGIRRYPVSGLMPAGAPRGFLDDAAACVEIMTGAPVPEGADTVIPYENLEIRDGVAQVRDDAIVRAGRNIHTQGSDCARDAVLAAAGSMLSAARIAVAASVGKTRLLVTRRPRIAIVSTGDELVEVSATPLDHQLRVSNAHGLVALFTPWAEVSRHHSGDDPAALKKLLGDVLSESDMVLVSGGVSAGKFDAVPATLESLGVRPVFHKIAQKPGKPLWFGVFGPSTPLRDRTQQESGVTSSGQDSGADAEANPPNFSETSASEILIFGLPGNPVSSLVCARRFVLPLLWAKLGWSNSPAARAPLDNAVDAPSRLTQYLPVRLEKSGDGGKNGVGLVAKPHAVNGSGDFATLGGSDGFVELPADENHYPAGTILSFFAWSP